MDREKLTRLLLGYFIDEVAKILNIFVEYQDIININTGNQKINSKQKKILQNLKKVVAKIAKQHKIAIIFLPTLIY